MELIQQKFFFSLGVAAILPVVPSDYTKSEEMEDILATPGDKREAQLLFQYDNIVTALKEKIFEFGLDAPPMFLSDQIDRTALTFLNKKHEVGLF